MADSSTRGFSGADGGGFRSPLYIDQHMSPEQDSRSFLGSWHIDQHGRPSKMKIRIQSATNGWIVKAGCMTLVFDDFSRFIAELKKWLRFPEKTEADYQKKYGRTSGVADPIWQEMPEE